MEEMIFNYIAKGGDVLVIALVYGLWKLDRRILKLETNVDGMKESMGRVERTLRGFNGGKK